MAHSEVTVALNFCDFSGVRQLNQVIVDLAKIGCLGSPIRIEFTCRDCHGGWSLCRVFNVLKEIRHTVSLALEVVLRRLKFVKAQLNEAPLNQVELGTLRSDCLLPLIDLFPPIAQHSLKEFNILISRNHLRLFLVGLDQVSDFVLNRLRVSPHSVVRVEHIEGHAQVQDTIEE